MDRSVVVNVDPLEMIELAGAVAFPTEAEELRTVCRYHNHCGCFVNHVELAVLVRKIDDHQVVVLGGGCTLKNEFTRRKRHFCRFNICAKLVRWRNHSLWDRNILNRFGSSSTVIVIAAGSEGGCETNH